MKSCLSIFFCFILSFLFTGIIVGSDYTKITNGADLGKYVGKSVLVEGKVSEIIWQHVIASPKTHPYFVYFDVGKGQTIVYTREKLSCKSDATVKCKVVEIKVVPKKPGETKISDETYSEYHIVAESVECKG